ncbi:unnamed protein product [Tuber aestivum]|uniref:Uncharacterized protein n=1 Tax=Tuber aestivum TaxID=59557 RepID=A0A292PRH1_9PEZI|nr:unnamed protein product [Tuber aestivum]
MLAAEMQFRAAPYSQTTQGGRPNAPVSKGRDGLKLNIVFAQSTDAVDGEDEKGKQKSDLVLGYHDLEASISHEISRGLSEKVWVVRKSRPDLDDNTSRHQEAEDKDQQRQDAPDATMEPPDATPAKTMGKSLLQFTPNSV